MVCGGNFSAVLTEYTRCVLLAKDGDIGLPGYVVPHSNSKAMHAQSTTMENGEEPLPPYDFVEEGPKKLAKKSRLEFFQ